MTRKLLIIIGSFIVIFSFLLPLLLVARVVNDFYTADIIGGASAPTFVMMYFFIYCQARLYAISLAGATAVILGLVVKKG